MSIKNLFALLFFGSILLGCAKYNNENYQRYDHQERTNRTNISTTPENNTLHQHRLDANTILP